ncbi:MAG: PorV/PorQ family protein [Bacteroidetes bacterium]|nr:PorV/PorQ family protein [Bacteroidota bacterium]
MKLKTTLVASALFLTHFAHAQDAPKYSNEFLSIGVGARGLGMSGAQVATVNDVTSGYWNPAGLTLGTGDLQIGLMHAEYFAGIAKYDFAGLAAPIDATRTVGFSFIRFAVDDIIDSTELLDADGNIDYDRLKSFSAADYAFLFTYAKKTKIEGLRYGVNAKVVHRKVGEFASAWGFGLDLGIQYDKNKWKFGAMGRDITSTFNAWSFNTEKLEDVFIQTGNEIPENGLEITLPKLILGASYKTYLKEKFSFEPEVNIDVTFDGKRNVPIKSDPISIDPKLGIEIGYSDFVFLRGGVSNIQKIKDVDGSDKTSIQPNFGLGVKIRNVSIDYALTNIGSVGETLYSNIFSLRVGLFKQKK